MKPAHFSTPRSTDGQVRLRVDRRKICQLIRAGHLCAADFSCLDCQSRDLLKRIFLQCSLEE